MVYGGGRRTGRAPGRRACPEPAAALQVRTDGGGGVHGGGCGARIRAHVRARAGDRAHVSDQSAVWSTGCPAETRTDCGVLIWMAGAARRQNRPAMRRFEPPRFESAPPLSRFKI